MRKQRRLFIVFVALFVILLTGCADETSANRVPIEDFAETSWERPIEGCVEVLYFGEDREFSNYEACGNEIDETFLCETYSYNEETGIIKLRAFWGLKVMSIEVISCEDDKLVLDFNGEIRTYERAE